MKNNQDHFNILRKVKSNPNLSQRELAKELGFSLGKLNYCLNALKKDSPGFNEMDYEYRWNKLDYNDYLDEQYISWALDISSYGQIEYKDGILSGDCLLLVWDDCNCDQCENEL